MIDDDNERGERVPEHILGVLNIQQDAQKHNVMSLWAIYDLPVDGRHVARRFEASDKGAGTPTLTEDSLHGQLEWLRSTLRLAGLVCIQREKQDEGRIMETWM
ncbi:hypothetical protein NLM33_33120 [Bradyrhizobium sp. CCGUVB1N3]|uniref:hypothetical protein n=1 Tax=Bradyrhizobium sp. CCGUVB1N3 TaxID=2949629 RepID=UPI0020B3A2B2|nr:hypothetical protein [Bradyrhizobium sp. CCGUVB1N3]MCP3475167.1 hypothetical protein [Bradyrhizobium sp. CCGUVB1N3]